MSVEEVERLLRIAVDHCRLLPQSRSITKILNMIDSDTLLNEKIRANRIAEIDLRIRVLIKSCDDEGDIELLIKWMSLINDAVIVSNGILTARIRAEFVKKHIDEFSTFCNRVRDCIPRMKTMEYAYGTFCSWHCMWHPQYLIPTMEEFVNRIIELDRKTFSDAIDSYNKAKNNEVKDESSEDGDKSKEESSEDNEESSEDNEDKEESSEDGDKSRDNESFILSRRAIELLKKYRIK